MLPVDLFRLCFVLSPSLSLTRTHTHTHTCCCSSTLFAPHYCFQTTFSFSALIGWLAVCLWWCPCFCSIIQVAFCFIIISTTMQVPTTTMVFLKLTVMCITKKKCFSDLPPTPASSGELLESCLFLLCELWAPSLRYLLCGSPLTNSS